MGIRVVAAAVTSAALFFSLRASAAEPVATRDARLTRITGRVLVFEAVSSEAAAAKTGMPLSEGDRVQVPSGASAEITIDGESVIQLGPDSDFTLSGMQRARTSFSLSFGSLLAKIKTLAAGESLAFHGPSAVAAVRGTELGVDAVEGQTRVGVFDEGRVEVSNEAGTQTLGPGQETRAVRGAAPEKPGPLDAFKDRRAAFKKLRKRFASAAKRWRTLTVEQRAQHRKEALERGRREERERREERHQQRREERRDLRQERRERRGGR